MVKQPPQDSPSGSRFQIPALFKKAFRDILEQRSMVLVISMMIMVGAGLFTTMISTLDSLRTTQEAYYQEYDFANLFASLKQAPVSVLLDVKEIPGVRQAQSRIVMGGNIEVDSYEGAIRGLVISIPDGVQPALNKLYLRDGQLPREGSTHEWVISDAFAEAHALEPGDSIEAILNGRKQTMMVSGIGLSPEYIYQGNPGTIVPEFERFGIFWMNQSAMEGIFQMKGAFNQLTVSLSRQANEPQILRKIDTILEPYGGLGAQPRERQASHFFITEEMSQLERMSTIIPVIFLGVASFLLSIVLNRLIRTQRSQIAILKAFGYSHREIGLHFVVMVTVILLLGLAGGILFGVWLGHQLSELYAEYYRFPFLQYRLDPSIFFITTLVSVIAAFSGVLRAVYNAVSLTPAEAMRPESPVLYRRSWIERLGLQKWLDQPMRMVLRQVSRHRFKSTMSVVGVGFAFALVMVGRMSEDALDLALDQDFRKSQPYDLSIQFERAVSPSAEYELARIPGVQKTEASRTVAVRFSHGHRDRLSSIQIFPSEHSLQPILDASGEKVDLPSEGLLLTESLGEALRLHPGDSVWVELLESGQEPVLMRVDGFMNRFFGSSGYATFESLKHLIPDGTAISGVVMEVRDGEENSVERVLKEWPLVAGITSTRGIIDLFYELTAQTWLITAFFVSLFAGGAAFSVVYNNARISLSERSRELASLRILGLTRGEVARVLIGEMWVVVLLAIPVGILLGWGLTWLIIESLQTEMYRIPMNISSETIARATVTILLTALISGVIIRRRIHKLNLIEVLKTRES